MYNPNACNSNNISILSDFFFEILFSAIKEIVYIVIIFFQIFTCDFHFFKKDFDYPEVFSSHL